MLATVHCHVDLLVCVLIFTDLLSKYRVNYNKFEQEFSYRKQIARKLCTQYVEGNFIVTP